MAGKVILICGKLCSGKSTLAARLAAEEKAAVLSVDRVMLRLFPAQLGDRHDEISGRVRALLLDHAVTLAGLGQNVLLDWGFWTRAGRAETEAFFRAQGIPTQWHYLAVDDAEWQRRIAKRNAEAPPGTYFVDGPLKEKCQRVFEEPEESERTALGMSVAS